ncbi:hypothetical protein [Azohydromonas caseinilytica]|uniref:Porin n=1 Tax=Azohydromonas caseinilytica TaxID=2728836 RepID=A0A848F8H9_9BURK|nr:hypothetical protein [Azohydromonas caseinilytica]NML15662.1 hypothetical protein [Azohydromonas caseinilytica]
MNSLLPAALVAALAAPAAAQTAPATPAVNAADLQALRDEIQTLRNAYEARLQALEQRLQAAESAARAPAAVAATPSAAPATAPDTVQTASSAAPAAAANAFNPAISLILAGQYTRTSRDPEGYRIAGFGLPPDAEAGPGPRGLNLGESELRFSASIDPWLRGAAALALHPDNEFSVEEAFVETTALGRGFTLRAGRFFSNVGYLNPQHAHTWDFVDNPLPYQALLGTQLGDDGLQLRWIAPTDQLLELSAEVGRGAGFPGGDSAGNGAGLRTFSVHTGGDIGDSHSWRAGVSVLQARASGQELIGLAADDTSTFFTGRTRVWIADAVWKWAPEGNATRTHFKLQGEVLQARRSGTLALEDGSGGDYRATQSGWYVQGVYQFMPRWRVGLRTERLDAGTPHDPAGLVAGSGFKPRKHALMLEFNPSEFSRVRLQLAQDRAREGAADRQFFIQYQMSLGAHGAHAY